jgi:hypothetical protein
MLDGMRAGPIHRRAQPRSDRWTVPWPTVALLAVLMAGATGFLVEALRGATGAISLTQHPFHNWLRDSALLAPMFAGGVFGALALARRRFGPALHAVRPVLGASALIVGVGTLIGIAALTADAAYNYHLQSDQLGLAHSLHSTALSGETSGDLAGHDHGSTGGTCSGNCLAQRQTLQIHIKGVERTSGLLLVSNLVIVGWVVALRGGRLDVARALDRADSTVQPSAAEPVPERVNDLDEYDVQHSG